MLRTRSWPGYYTTVGLAVVCLFMCRTTANGAEDKPPEAKYETLLEDLDQPLDVTRKPETGDLYVSEAGDVRVLRLRDPKNIKSEPAITDYEKSDATGLRHVGPHALLFMNNELLLVSEVDAQNEQSVRVFSVPNDAAPMKAAAAKYRVALPTRRDDDRAMSAPVNLAFSGGTVFIARTSEHAAGQLLQFGFSNLSAPTSVTTVLPTTPDAKFDSVSAIDFGRPHGEILIAQQAGSEGNRSSYVSFYYPQPPRLLMKFDPRLPEICGLAYSPKTGRLYAIDAGRQQPDTGGLYRLDATAEGIRGGVKAVRIASLDRPTAMYAHLDGSFFVTTLGKKTDPASNTNEHHGQLLKFTDL